MTIVVGYVPKPEGRAALEWAIDEAARRGSRLVVLNTSSGAATVDRAYAGSDDWEAAQARLADSGVDYEARQAVTGGDASEAIVEAVEATNAELVVIGLRRRSPVGKLILGSQAQQILLSAPCPVTAVKAD